MKTVSEIKEIILQAKELQLESVEIDGVIYRLGKTLLAPVSEIVEDAKPEDLIAPLSVLDEYSEEEIQYWSTSYFDEIQARKEAQKNQQREDDELKQSLAS